MRTKKTKRIKNRKKRNKRLAEKLKDFNRRVNKAREYFSNREKPNLTLDRRKGDMANIPTFVTKEAMKREEERLKEAEKQQEEAARLQLENDMLKIEEDGAIILKGWDDPELEAAISAAVSTGKDEPEK